MSYRSTGSFGKRQEYAAISKLLSLGFDVYMTLVDDQQIDCVVRQEKEGKLRYLDIQIKARSKTAKYCATFSAMNVRKPRRDFWFLFYSEPLDTYWVIPSLDLVKLASKNKGGPDGLGKHKGKLTLNLANKNKGGWKPRPKFDNYKNNFDLLNWDETRGSAEATARVSAR